MGSLCDEIEKFGKGVGNAGRYRILEALMNGSKTVGELVKKVKLSQSLVSQHLKTLRECDLVNSERKGKEVYYSINVEYTVSLLKHLALNINKCKKKI